MRALVAVAFGLGTFSSVSSALGQSTIKRPGDRPPYAVELEPHLGVGLFEPPGYGYGDGFGAGVRGSVEILKVGFIPKLNNSIAIGFGADYLRYEGWQGTRGTCEHFETAPGGVPVCTRVSGGSRHANYVFLPVVMQWNFWLHRRWSVFGEPGLALYVQNGHMEFDPFVFYVGGRFHITDRITLTMRLGYPTFSLGVSFLL